MSKPAEPRKQIAVALLYDEKSAPRVTAKGQGHIADEIIRLAQAHEIPIKEEPEVVKLLSQVDLGQVIPPTLYVAVAEIIAFAYMLKGKHPAP
jgi:flagellar biosynthesis protein